MKHLIHALIFGLLPLAPLPGLASTCPPAPDHGAQMQGLIAQLQQAETQLDGQRLSDALWALWADAPDEAAQAVLDAGMSKRTVYDYAGALAEFDRLVAYCPDYAEGYNQRAFIHYLRGDYAPALVQLDAALERQPLHIAALAGKALTLIAMGRDREGQMVLAEALKLNPWLPERGLFRPELLGEEL
jgi:tetratricopeptide (TPR) repeat protein